MSLQHHSRTKLRLTAQTMSSPSATSPRRNERTTEISVVENDDGELSEANGAATTASAEIRAVVPTHIYHRRDTRRHFLSLTRKATVQQARELAYEEEEHTTRAVVAAETAETHPNEVVWFPNPRSNLALQQAP